MNLRRARVYLALVYGVVAAVAVGALALYSVSAGTQHLDQQALTDLQTRVGQFIAQNASNALPTTGYNTWVVDTRTHVVYTIGVHDVQPPVSQVVARAGSAGGTATETVEIGRTRYGVSAQRVFRTEFVVVIAASFASTTAAVARLRLYVALFAVALVLFTSAMAYVVSGWALRPARRAARQQREFLANAAHQLRSPIAVIQATASQALQRPRDPEAYRVALAEVRSAAARAGAGVSDLLDLARLESGQVVPHRVPLRLDLLCEEVVATAADGAATAGPAGSRVGVGPSVPVVVEADEGLLRQAVDNLVRNGLRQATRVTVATSAWGRDAVVEVTDNGPGFAPDFLPHAFDRFRSDGHADPTGGTGLGLAIVKSIVEAHGGTVEASNRPGGGALIRIRVPGVQPTPAPGP